MNISESTCEKWQDVSFAGDSEPICGTLFLLSPNSEDTAIQWIPLSGNTSDDHIPPKISLSCIAQVERRRLGFNRRYNCIFFRTSQNHIYGPFEFTHGGSGEFLNKLRSFIDLHRMSDDPEVYKVTRKSTTYQLPTPNASATPLSLIQGVGTHLLNFFEGLKVSADPALDVEGTSFYPDRSAFGSLRLFNPEVVSSNSVAFVAEHILSDRVPPFGETFTSSSAPGDDADYQIISRAPPTIIVPDLSPVPRRNAVRLEDWQRYLDREGRVTVVEKLQNAIYGGGIDPELRPIAWKYLFGYLKWDYSEAENAARVKEKHQHYHIMKSFWQSMSAKQIRNNRGFRERKSIIEKDTFRTDRQVPLFRDNSAGSLTRLYNVLMTYTFYNNDLGYFQGMNDILAVIMTVIDGEEDAFWCFSGLLERIADNFSEGSSSLYSQFHNLFKLIEILMPRFAQFLREKDATSMSFCFKWFLIIFKREFSYDDVKVLWETLFNGAAPKNFHLLVAVAIFDAEADTIMRTCIDSSQILQYINSLSEKINLTNVLSRAQGIYNQLFEVRDHLPNEVAVFLGFTSPLTPSSSDDARNRSSVDDEGLLVACNFPLKSASPSSPTKSPTVSGLEVGEDIANLVDA